MKRRSAIKTLGLVAGSTLAGRKLAQAAPAGVELANGDRQMSVLIDTTRCLGCRLCEKACAAANDLPEAPVPGNGERAQLDEKRWTVVQRFDTERGTVHVKRQCMHCVRPACASACLTRAMIKTETGPVVWRGDKCMGCRFCMISCPFDAPKFEYDSPNPRIRKCRLCWDRVAEGEAPACVEACPAGASSFGTRAQMLELAYERIYQSPERYVHHVYGEHEAGGTNVLYLAAVPFEQLGFRTDLATSPYPDLTTDFLYAVPFVLTLVPPFLLAVSRATEDGGDDDPGGSPWQP